MFVKRYMTILVPSEIPCSSIWHLNFAEIFFYPGVSDTKGMFFVLLLGLESTTKVDTDPKGSLCILRLLPLITEFSVYVPLRGIAP